MHGLWASCREGLSKAVAPRPAAPVALLLIGGITCHRLLWHAPLVWAGMLVFLAAWAALAAARSAARRLGTYAAIWCLGLGLAQFHAFHYPTNHIGQLATDLPLPVDIEMRLDCEPRVLAAAESWRPLPPRMTATASVLSADMGTGPMAVQGTVLVQIDEIHPGLAAQQRIRTTGMLQRPSPAMNPGQFDWEQFYGRQRILASVTIKHAADIKILAAGHMGMLERLRQRIRQALAEGFDQAQALDHSLLRALLLGDRDWQMRQVQEDFAASGTAYQLAVSGMHVAVLGELVLLICRLLCLRPRFSALAVMIFVLAYALATAPAAPIFRAAILCETYALSMLLWRNSDRIQLLALAAIAVLAVKPLELYDPGFQLSFGTVLGLMIVGRRAVDFFNAPWELQDRLAFHNRTPGRWETLRRMLRRKATDALAFNIIAWLISVPLVALHFEQLNPYTLAGGLLLFPCVVVALAGALAKVLLTLLLPSLAGLWAQGAVLPMYLVRHVVGVLARIPGADVPLPAPSMWLIALFYALLCLPLLPTAVQGRRTWLRLGPVAACLIALLGPVAWRWAPRAASDGELRVTLLAIGAGQIGVVELPGGDTVLIDDGSSTLPDPVRTCLEPFLRTRGKGSVRAIFLSHPDFDHISGAAVSVDRFSVREVYLNPVFEDQAAGPTGTTAAEAMLNHVRQSACGLRIISAGERLMLDDSTTLDVLWPPAGRPFKSTNNAGLVLRISCHGRSILFPADIQAPTEDELVTGTKLASDVLVAPHHGSAEPGETGLFIQAVHPQWIVASNDRVMSQKQRKFDEIMAAVGTPFWRTSRYGAITIRIGVDGGVTMETFLTDKRMPDRARAKTVNTKR